MEAQEENTDTISLQDILEEGFVSQDVPETLDALSEYVTESTSPQQSSIESIFYVIFIILSFYLLFIFIIPNAILLINFVRKLFSRWREKKSKKCLQEIYKYLSDEQENPSVFLQKSSAFILTRIIYDLTFYIEGADRIKLENLYKKLGLEKYLLYKIKTSFFSTKAYYLKISSVISPSQKALSVLKWNAHAQNKECRLYAMQGLIQLNPSLLMPLFASYSYPLSLWEQLNYYDFFVSKNISVPDFHPLALSKNDSIAIFAIRMVRMFKQKRGSLEGYERLLTHKNLEVQFEMFKTLAELEYKNLSGLLTELIPRTNPYIQRHIISYLARTPHVGMEVLMQYYRDYEDPDFRLHILYCIYNFLEGGKKEIENFSMQSEDLLLRQLSTHLLHHVL